MGTTVEVAAAAFKETGTPFIVGIRAASRWN